uniref:Putative secreted protein n=1 Tax=Anopheles marajoara TaxID=58244 RepID=A0A2M4C9W9_9DIPT
MIFGWLPFIAFHHYGSGAVGVPLSRVYDDSWLSWVGHTGLPVLTRSIMAPFVLPFPPLSGWHAYGAEPMRHARRVSRGCNVSSELCGGAD